MIWNLKNYFTTESTKELESWDKTKKAALRIGAWNWWSNSEHIEFSHSPCRGDSGRMGEQVILKVPGTFFGSSNGLAIYSLRVQNYMT
jgi:hypothetical protein